MVYLGLAAPRTTNISVGTMITDDEIDEIAAQRTAMRRGSAKRTPFGEDYERRGVCGEVALYELFGSSKKPEGRLIYGDNGIDFRVRMLDRDNQRITEHTVDVKCAEYPKYLWVKPPPRADVYVLARYSPQTRRAVCIKWCWGIDVAAAPITTDKNGIRHHEILGDDCLELNRLLGRCKQP
jgi:hypothetical protein